MFLARSSLPPLLRVCQGVMGPSCKVFWRWRVCACKHTHAQQMASCAWEGAWVESRCLWENNDFRYLGDQFMWNSLIVFKKRDRPSRMIKCLIAFFMIISLSSCLCFLYFLCFEVLSSIFWNIKMIQEQGLQNILWAINPRWSSTVWFFVFFFLLFKLFFYFLLRYIYLIIF